MYWRIRIPQGKGSYLCMGGGGVDIREIVFYCSGRELLTICLYTWSTCPKPLQKKTSENEYNGYSTCTRVRFAHACTHGGAIGTHFLRVIFAVVFGQALHVYRQIVSNSRPEQQQIASKPLYPDRAADNVACHDKERTQTRAQQR